MLNQVLNSGPVLLLTKHWILEMPTEVTEGESWQKVTREHEVFHKHLPTEQLYRAESNPWLAAKTIGLLWVGGYFYFGAAMARHLGEGLFESAMAAHRVFQSWKQSRSNPDFNYPTFLQNNRSEFGAAKAQFSQSLKDLALFAPLYLSDYRIPKWFFYAIYAFTLHNPKLPRVTLEAIQRWWQPQAGLGGAMPQALEPFDQLTNGTYSLTKLFKLNALGIDTEIKKD